MSSHKPLGVFWHLNQTYLSDHLSASDCVNGLRRFLSNKFSGDCIEYQFTCVCNRILINDNLIQSLRSNGCHIIDIDSESKAILQLHNIIDKFVQNYGFESIVAIISDDLSLSRTIRLVTHKDVYVVLIYGRDSSQELVMSADEAIAFDDLFGLNRTVILSVSNLPTFKSRNAIRTAFQPFCRQFHCKFRFVRKDTIKLEFTNKIDAQSAEQEIRSKEFFGHELVTEFEILSQSQGSSASDSSSSPQPLISMKTTPKQEIDPQKDDECKSVIIGLFSTFNQNVFNLVRDLVNSWNDSTVNGTMIVRVNRERDFVNRDGKASLIVTAIDRKSNNKLIASAKNNFVDRENKYFWNRLRRSPKKELQTPEYDVSPKDIECRSVVIGLWTKHDENVLKTIKNLVKSWEIIGFDIKSIVYAERSKKFFQRDGKASLIISTDSPENNRKLLEFASKKFHNKGKKFYWKSVQKTQSNSSESH